MLRLRGIIYLALSSFVIWHEFGEKTGNEWLPKVEKWASSNPYLDIFATIFLVIIGIIVIVYFFKGLNLTFISGGLTKEEYKRTPFGNVIWGGGSIASYNAELSSDSNKNGNIENIKKYRDAKFSTMTNEEKANDYKQTAWIDGLDSNNTKNASKAKEYINSKLSTMDNETAYKWIKNK